MECYVWIPQKSTDPNQYKPCIMSVRVQSQSTDKFRKAYALLNSMRVDFHSHFLKKTDQEFKKDLIPQKLTATKGYTL